MPLPLLVVIGVAIGVVSATPQVIAIAAALGGASISAVLPARARRVALALALTAAAASVGAGARDAALQSTLVAALEPVLDDRLATPVWLEGRIADDAAVSRDAVLVSIDVTRARAGALWRPVSGRATLSVGGQSAVTSAGSWTRGRVFAAPALVRRPQMWLNFGGPTERWQRLRRTSDITGTVKSAALVEVRTGSRLSEAGAAIRHFVRLAVASRVAPISHASSAVVTAILIGDRTSLDAATELKLQRAGTFHVIAISGGNIAIVVMACLVALRIVVRSGRVVAVLTMGVVVSYGALVGDQASVERAVAAAIVVLALQAAGWAAPAWRIFLLAAMAVVLLDPLTVIDAGAWLSFGATLGILLLARPIANGLQPAAPHEVSTGRLAKPRRAMALLLAATIAAELALIPVTAAVFSQVSLAGLLLNFVAIPAMAVVQLSGIAIVALTALGATAAATIAATVAHFGVQAILESARLVDVLPRLAWHTPPVHLTWTAGYYLAAMLAIVSKRRRLRITFAGAAALSLAVIMLSPVLPPAGLARAGWLRVTFLDVGQGDAILVQFPTGQSLLVDAGGSATGFDIGTRVVRQALWALGVRRLDWLAVTHGDVDHAGGALSLINQFAPREVWEGVPVVSNDVMQQLRIATAANRGAWARLVAGQSLEVGSVAVDVLNPPQPDWERPATRNDDSIVLRLAFGDVSVMLTGDIGTGVERALPLVTQPRLRLLKAPHHGSRTSSGTDLIAGWLPQAVVMSVGRGNTFGHPAPDVLARYGRHGVDIFRTDRDGAISLDTDGREVQVRTARGRTWRLTAVTR